MQPRNADRAIDTAGSEGTICQRCLTGVAADGHLFTALPSPD